MNLLHERALRIVYKDTQLSFQELLILDKSFCIHHRNLQKLATEMFKIKNSLSPILMLNLFPSIENVYNFRNEKCWESYNVRTVGYGTETLLFRGKKTWQLLPDSIKKTYSLAEFKIKIKKWLPTGCTCRLCKTYISNVGFIIHLSHDKCLLPSISIVVEGQYIPYCPHQILALFEKYNKHLKCDKQVNT